ncbi:MAG: C39 family peptidase [Cyanobacteriota bacterium]|nr:C39 family peptidase [Cyanobacteriota bacterium]
MTPPLRRKATPAGLLALAGLALALPALAQPTTGLAEGSCRSMGARPVEVITVLVLVGSLIALAVMERRLRREGWSLAQALSEPLNQGSGGRDPSSSRLFAMAGMVVILLLYLGFGVFALYNFGMTCTMPASTGAVTSFLYAGLTLFAPYIANKFSNLFRPMAAGQALSTAPPEVIASPDQPPLAVVRRPAPPPATAPAPCPAPAATPAAAGDPYAPAVTLIAQFEGFVDHAYPDPASGGEPWTIGYGFTQLNGRPVRPGDSISRTAADAQLASGVQACARHLGSTIPYWGEMAADQCCALISFAWNLGEDFYGNETNFHTISLRLRNRDWAAVPDALMLYCNPGTAVEAGLRRRRQAEGDLWRQGMASPAAAPPAPAAAHPNPLAVPWYDQLSMDDGQGWRDCFSASSAMLAAYWGKEPDENTYNHLRQHYGDSTSSEAQLAALRHLGLQAQFHTDGTLADLKAEIDAGRPVAVGWLHHGPPSAPSGGGHWTVVIGYDDTGVIMNDPYGSCDLVNGGYPANHNGAHQHYSYKNWLPRWQPQGSGGWYLSCHP